MNVYEFTNGTLLKGYWVRNYLSNGRLEVNGVVYKNGEVETNSNSLFINAKASDIKLFDIDYKAACVSLIDKNSLLKPEITEDEYKSLDPVVQKLYKHEGRVTERTEANVEVVKADCDYKKTPKFANFFSYEDNDDTLKYYTPCEITGRRLVELINSNFKTDYFKGEVDYDLIAYGTQIYVTKYAKVYEGEMKKVEKRKQNGQSYASPQYRTVRATPDVLYKHEVDLAGLTLDGENAFDLNNKVTKIIQALSLPL